MASIEIGEAYHPQRAMQRLTARTLNCITCDNLIAPLDAVSIQGSVYCADCAFAASTALLSAYLVPGWTPADTKTSRRDYDEAREVVRLLLARIDARRERGV